MTRLMLQATHLLGAQKAVVGQRLPQLLLYEVGEGASRQVLGLQHRLRPHLDGLPDVHLQPYTAALILHASGDSPAMACKRCSCAGAVILAI